MRAQLKEKTVTQQFNSRETFVRRMAESPGVAPSPPPPPDLAGQKRLIRQNAEKSLRKNDIWCLIDTRWFKQWKKYVGYDEHDNSQVYVGNN